MKKSDDPIKKLEFAIGITRQQIASHEVLDDYVQGSNPRCSAVTAAATRATRLEVSIPNWCWHPINTVNYDCIQALYLIGIHKVR